MIFYVKSRLQAALLWLQKQQACSWEYDDMYDCWEGTCGVAWCLYEGTTPRENRMNYCPVCGRPLLQMPVDEHEQYYN